MKRDVLVSVGSWVMALVAAAGCTPLHAKIPAQIVARSEVLPITERSAMSGALADESFKVGAYAVTNVDRKWDSSSSASLGNYQKEATEGGYSFAFAGGDLKLAGECVTGKLDKTRDLGAGFTLD